MRGVHKQPANTGRIPVISNRYRCRAFRTGEISSFYTCIVMFDTHDEAIFYAHKRLASMNTPADRVTAEWLFDLQKEA